MKTLRILSIAVLALALGTLAAWAQTGTNLTKVGEVTLGGTPNTVVQAGNHVYLDDGPDLVVYDVTDPTSMQEVARVDVHFSSNLSIFGVVDNRVYIHAAYNDFLKIYDVSDPTNPDSLAQYDFGGTVYGGWAPGGSYIYVKDNMRGVHALNVSDPAAITDDGTINSTQAWEFYTDGAQAVYRSLDGSYNSEFRVATLTTPTSLTDEGSTTPYDSFGEMLIEGDRCYVVYDSYDSYHGFGSFDITDPAAPVEQDTITYDHDYDGFDAKGDYLAFSDFGLGVRLLDFTDPTDIIEVGSMSGSFGDLSWGDSLIYVSYYDGSSYDDYLYALRPGVDASGGGGGDTGVAPTSLTADLDESSGEVTLGWSHADAAVWPGPPSSGATNDTLTYDEGNATGTYTWSGATMATRMTPSQSCQILELWYFTAGTDNFNAEVYGWDGSSPTTSLIHSVSGVAVTDGGWTVVDLSGDNVTTSGDFVVGFGSINTTASLAYDSNLDNGRSWDYSGGSWSSYNEAYIIRAVVQYSDGTTATVAPSPVVTIPASTPVGVRTAHALASGPVRMPEAVACTGFDVLRDGTSITTTDYDGYLDALSSTGTYEYVVRANYDDGTSYDSDPVTVTWSASGVDESAASGPREFALSRAWPNPFNPSTVLTLALPEASEVTVAVYDLLGRRVATLAEGVMAAGTHRVHFDAAGLASGVYFVRATTPGQAHRVQRVTLVR